MKMCTHVDREIHKHQLILVIITFSYHFFFHFTADYSCTLKNTRVFFREPNDSLVII